MTPDVTHVKTQANFELLSNGTVEWTDEIDISPDTLYIAGQTVAG